jgi:hypothetical protein
MSNISTASRALSESSLRVKDVPEMSRASSTASSVSIQLPITPRDTEGAQSPTLPDTGKSLPPLPTSIANQRSSGLAVTPSRSSVPRSRAYSSASSASSTGRDPSIASIVSARPSTTTHVSITTATPRPLRLTSSKSLSTPASHRGAVDPTNEGYSRHLSDQQRLRAASGPRYSDSLLMAPSSTTSRPAPAVEDQAVKPKPRTGTGMTYRTASHSPLGVQSRMRMPGSSYGASSGLPRIPVAAPRGVAF